MGPPLGHILLGGALAGGPVGMVGDHGPDAVKDPASHFAIVNYLQRSPRGEAKAALRLLASQRR